MTKREVLLASKLETGVHIFKRRAAMVYSDEPTQIDAATQQALDSVVNAYHRKEKIAKKKEDGFREPSEPVELAVPADRHGPDFAISVGKTAIRLYAPMLMVVDVGEATRNSIVSQEAERAILQIEDDYPLGLAFALRTPDFEWQHDDPAHARIHTCLGRFALPAAYVDVDDTQEFVARMQDFAMLTVPSRRLVGDSTEAET